MEFKDFLKLRYMFLKQQKEVEDNLPNQIRISAKIHEIGLILDFLENKNVENTEDGSGTYLYSAYIKNAENESDVEFLDGQNPDGYAVCFELQKRLEDIVRTGNLQEITQVLTLLSDARNFQDMRQLTYIGEVDKNGQVNRKEKSSSSAIQSRIEVMKQEFARAMQQRDQGQQK